MAINNTSSTALTGAFTALAQALDRLEAAAAIASEKRGASVAEREETQASITESWQVHSAGIESERDALAEENTFLKDDNLRLSNQLQALQQEYVALQETAASTLSRLDGSIKQLDMLLEH